MYGLKVTTAGEHRFKRVLSYRTYRLCKKEGERGPSVASNTGVIIRRLVQVMESHVVDGTDPISVL